MLDIRLDDAHQVVLTGRLDASQAAAAQAFLDKLGPPCVIDASGLEYISSAGLGVLLKTHKRLMAAGSGIRLVNLRPQVHEVFHYAGLDKLFSITSAAAGG